MSEKIRALVEGGSASAGPPLGPQLGPLGVNIGKVISKINEETEEFEGMDVPVTVKVDEETKDFEIEVGTPPVSAMVRKETGLDKLSSHPHEDKVANMLIEQCIKIAKAKMPDLNSPTMKSAVKQVVASCLTSGVLVEDKDPREVLREIDEGKYSQEIDTEKTELTEEEKRELEKEKEELREEIKEKEKEAREKAKKIIEEVREAAEEEEEEVTRDELVQKLEEEEIPMEIIQELLPEEEGEEEEGEKEDEEPEEEDKTS